MNIQHHKAETKGFVSVKNPINHSVSEMKNSQSFAAKKKDEKLSNYVWRWRSGFICIISSLMTLIKIIINLMLRTITTDGEISPANDRFPLCDFLSSRTAVLRSEFRTKNCLKLVLRSSIPSVMCLYGPRDTRGERLNFSSRLVDIRTLWQHWPTHPGREKAESEIKSPLRLRKYLLRGCCSSSKNVKSLLCSEQT